MKHTAKITLILLAIFTITQFFGIIVIYNYIDFTQSEIQGETVFSDLPIGERPDIAQDTSYIPIMIVIIVGTLLLLLLIKFKAFIVWRIWFLLAVIITSLVSIAAFIKPLYAFILALGLGIWKVFKPNPIIHNFTEILVYSGLAAIFVPIFNLTSIIILLILISIYDMYAVWKSKHMIKLAKAQSQAKVFAGLLVPYKLKKKSSKTKHKKGKKGKKTAKKVPQKIRTAILGGGDIGFPLIFTGVILKDFGLAPSLIIPIFTTIGLGLLFYYGNEKKFYPAMPFITAACLVGLGFVWAIGIL